MSEHIGEGSCVSITTTKPEPSEDYFATIATSQSDTLNRRQLRSRWPITSDFTTEAIISIEPDGIAEVFDVQIADTENFIANGLVSHNTRWHTDDLVGRLQSPEFIQEMKDAGIEDEEKWEHINLQAIAGVDDPLGRKPGEALYPEAFPVNRLKAIKATLGSYLWAALYDGNPVPAGGNYFDPEKFNLIERSDVPRGMRWVRYWDLGAVESDTADFTASPRAAMDADGNFYLADMIEGKWIWPKTRKVILNTSVLEQIEVGVEAVAGFKTAFANLKEVVPPSIMVREYGADKDKLTRALPWIALVENGKAFLVRGDWVTSFKNQCREFPAGANDDQIDGVSGCYAMLTTKAATATMQRLVGV